MALWRLWLRARRGDPPDRCPKCGAPREKFAEIPAEAASLLDRSRRSNALHAKLHALMGKARKIAEQGIEDNLDPGCVTVFRHAAEEATVIEGMVKAEIASHLGKGKWG